MKIGQIKPIQDSFKVKDLGQNQKITTTLKISTLIGMRQPKFQVRALKFFWEANETIKKVLSWGFAIPNERMRRN